LDIMQKLVLCLVAAFILAPAIAYSSEPPGDVGDPLEWLVQVEQHVFLAVKPQDELDDAIWTRFKVVVDLRFPYEGTYNELGQLRNRGVEYVNIPTSSRTPSSDSVSALEDLIAQHQNQAIVIHDSNGHRAAMLYEHILR
jgi:protein tyrosine phosphatase (PTP) superfamily phosphohydrolase (DUF442 family)